MITHEDATSYAQHMAVAVLCAELAHELLPTLTFLRDFVRSPGALDRSIAAEEIERLETVIASLRRTRRRESEVASVSVAQVAVRAAQRVEAATGRAPIAIEVPHDFTVVANEAALELLMVALLHNARRAAADGWVRLRATAEDAGWSLEIEDDGPGLPGDLAGRLFHPLATLAAGGGGTGIPTALRIARDHGWELGYARERARTVIRIVSPSP